jgi:hypothetical protein
MLMPLVMLLWHVRRKRGTVTSLLAARPQLDARAFGRAYFGEVPGRMELAAALREQLAQHVPFRLDGLRPEDRLFEDLWMHQWDHLVPGEFLRDVEEAYSIQLPDAILSSGTRFRDIVDEVERCVLAKGPAERAISR